MNENLRKARTNKGYTQLQMAQFLGYRTASGYNLIEKGKVQPSVGIALRISDLLEADVRLLFDSWAEQAATSA